MKTRITNYTFVPASGQVTFNDYTAISLDGVLLVSNAVAGTILYSFADPALGGTVAGNVLDLETDCSAMNAGDALVIYYDDPAELAASEATLQTISNLQEALFELIARLDFLPSVRGLLADLRVTPTGTVTVAGSLTTLTTVTNVTSVNQLGGWPTNAAVPAISNTTAILGNINNTIGA